MEQLVNPLDYSGDIQACYASDTDIQRGQCGSCAHWDPLHPEIVSTLKYGFCQIRQCAGRPRQTRNIDTCDRFEVRQ